MSFKRLDPEDFLLSTDAIAAPAFAGGSSNSTGTTVANSGVSDAFYKTYNGGDNRPEFSLAFGDQSGNITGSKVVYKQFANIIQGTDVTSLPVGTKFLAITVERSRYKQTILPSTFSINGIIGTGSGAPDSFKSGSTAQPSPSFVETGSTDVTFTDAGRQFKNSTSTLFLYPDIGTALISSSATVLPTTIAAARISVDSEEVITSNYIFIRARNAEFNYSQNPTFIDSTTGGVRYTDFITAPQTFITTVGLYNDNGDLLSVAKLSKPLKKDFTKEALIRIKLDF